MFIGEKSEKIWKKIDLVATEIDIVEDVVTNSRDEESKQNHEKINKAKEEVENEECNTCITLNMI